MFHVCSLVWINNNAGCKFDCLWIITLSNDNLLFITACTAVSLRWWRFLFFLTTMANTNSRFLQVSPHPQLGVCYVWRTVFITLFSLSVSVSPRSPGPWPSPTLPHHPQLTDYEDPPRDLAADWHSDLFCLRVLTLPSSCQWGESSRERLDTLRFQRIIA